MTRHGWKGSGGTARREACPAELVDGMAQLFMHMRDHLERGAQRFDVPAPCVKALRIIDGSVSMKELAARIRCDASFVTAIADMLEERGLARREVDPADRRIKNLVLTDKGKAMRRRVLDEVFGDIPGLRTLDERERASLLKLLHTMARREAAGGEESGSAA